MQAASPSLCTGACALWAAGLTLGPLAVYVWLVFGLRARFLAGAVELDAASLGREHPGRRRLPWIHALLAWPVLFGGFVGGAVLGDLLAPKPAAFGFGATIAVIVFTGFSALFELITGVHPRFGPILRGTNRQTFAVGPGIRRLGLVRLAIGLGLAALLGGALLVRG